VASNGGRFPSSGFPNCPRPQLPLSFSLLTTATLYWLNQPLKSKSKLWYDRRSVGRSVLVSSTHLGLKTRYFLCESCGFVDVGHLLWRREDLVDRTDVSEERIASIFRVEKSASEEPAWTGGCTRSTRRHIPEDGILQCTIYLHFTCYDMNVYTICVRLLSVQAQHSRLCPIFSSFNLWILMVILPHEI
jgi:hypothetical protein